MSKLMIFVFVVFFAVPAFVFADESKSTGEFLFGVRQGEVHPLLSRALHNEVVLVNQARIQGSSGLFASGWYTFQPGKPTTGLGPAVDAEADAAHLELGVTGRNILFSTGVHNMYPMSHVSGGEDLLEQRLKFGLGRLSERRGEIWGVNLGVSWVSTTKFRDGALVVQPEVVNRWENAFGFPSATLRQRFTVSVNQGFEGAGVSMSSAGIFLQWELEVEWELDEHQTFLRLPSFVRQFPLKHGDDGRGEEWELTAGVGFRF